MVRHENRSHLTLAMILLASCWGLSSASVCWASLNNLRMAASLLGQQPNNTGACGGQPLCVETSDFNATVTSFRTSTGGTSRIINVSVRFQNRTAQPLVLGYVANSGMTTDEINTTGNQPALGGEFPLHFEGLANGVSQGVGSVAGAPDGLANAVSN